MSANDSKMNGGAHHMPLNQQQSLPSQQPMMMAGNGVDQQMIQQQQRMWTPNGPMDQHGRPLYQTPIGGQMHPNSGEYFFNLILFALHFLLTHNSI